MPRIRSTPLNKEVLNALLFEIDIKLVIILENVNAFGLITLSAKPRTDSTESCLKLKKFPFLQYLKGVISNGKHKLRQ